MDDVRMRLARSLFFVLALVLIGLFVLIRPESLLGSLVYQGF